MSISLASDIKNLFTELSSYHIKLTAYARQAGIEHKPNIARLLKALSFSKEVQALLILREAVPANDLSGSIDCYYKSAGDLLAGRPDPSPKGADILAQISEIDSINEHFLLCIKDALRSQKDLNLGDINVCSKCGYTVLGNAPRECAICHVPSGYFRIF